MTSASIEKVENYRGLMMATSPAEALRRLQELQAFVQEVMVEGEDYGKIPGVDKRSLFQPGAQKLAEIYGFAHRFEVTEQVKDWDRGFFYFEYKCVLTDRRTGALVAEGLGSCNSKEDKYAYRWLFDNQMPPGVDTKTLKRKEGEGRNGHKWVKFRLPNDDLFSVVNTLQKMGAKRAYVHAVVSATRSGGLFTQDVEDGEAEEIPAEAFGKVDERRPWEQGDTSVFDGHWTALEGFQTQGTIAEFDAITRKRTDDAALMTLAQRLKLRDFAVKVREDVRARDPQGSKKEAAKSPTPAGVSPTEQASNGSNPGPVRDQGTRPAQAGAVAEGDTGERSGSTPDPWKLGGEVDVADVKVIFAGQEMGPPASGAKVVIPAPPADARDWTREGQELWVRVEAAKTLDALTVLGDQIAEFEKMGAPSTHAIRKLLGEKMSALEPPQKPEPAQAPAAGIDWTAQEKFMEGCIRQSWRKGSEESDHLACDKMLASFMKSCPAAMAQRLAKMLREAKTGKLEPELPFR